MRLRQTSAICEVLSGIGMNLGWPLCSAVISIIMRWMQSGLSSGTARTLLQEIQATPWGLEDLCDRIGDG